MINHARTLLMNVAGPFREDVRGDEIIEPSFRPLILPESLQRARRILFGKSPEREMLNYRSQQFLRLLEPDAELWSFLTRLDSRQTFRPAEDDSGFLSASSFDPVITAYNNAGTLSVVGQLAPPDLSGLLRRDFYLEVDGNRLVESRQKFVSSPLEVSGGLSQPVRLPGCDVYVMISEPQDGQAWQLTLRSRPQYDLGQLLAMFDQLGGEALYDFFRRGQAISRVEPWQTFIAMFYRHYDLPHRLGGILLNLIYRSDELRTTA